MGYCHWATVPQVIPAYTHIFRHRNCSTYHLATIPQVMVGDRLPWGGQDKGAQGCVPSFLVNRFLRLQALAPLCGDWVFLNHLHHLLHKTAHLRRWHSDYVQNLQNFMSQQHFQNYTAYVLRKCT